MRGFQQGPDYMGIKGIGRVKLLEDRDGDGHFEHSKIFAENINFPTGILPAFGGLLVGAAPDLLFLKDTDGDGAADIRKALLTGFGQGNHEQLLNSSQWGLDNWIHAASGGVGGNIRIGGNPEVDIGTRNFRFRMPMDNNPPAFEITSGGGQWGLTTNDWGDWFTCHKARHI